MRRLIAVALLMVVGCGPLPDGRAETTSQALTHYPCGSSPVRSLDVTYSNGSCIKYFVPTTSDLSAVYLINDVPIAFITSVKTNDMSAAWVCDTNTPRGFSEARHAPCWSGSVNNGVVRAARA